MVGSGCLEVLDVEAVTCSYAAVTGNDLNPFFMKEIFQKKNSQYDLEISNRLQVPKNKSFVGKIADGVNFWNYLQIQNTY